MIEATEVSNLAALQAANMKKHNADLRDRKNSQAFELRIKVGQKQDTGSIVPYGYLQTTTMFHQGNSFFIFPHHFSTKGPRLISG